MMENGHLKGHVLPRRGSSNKPFCIHDQFTTNAFYRATSDQKHYSLSNHPARTMQPMLRIARAPGARLMPSFNAVPRRFAHQSYGNVQSGHPQADNQAPRRDVEHPGPEAPATKGTASTSSGSSSSSSSTQQSGTSTSHAGSNRPAIHQPESAAEQDDPEVRKHNEEMRNRAETTTNQLSEDDNKVSSERACHCSDCANMTQVPPSFWKGDVGDPQKSNDQN